MKLLVETNQVGFLTEGSGANKQYFIEGVFLQTEVRNRNGRIYPKSIMEREVDRYITEFVNQRRAFGELGHPPNPTINLPLVSHRIISLKEQGNNYVGKASIMDTPNGRIVKAFIDDGAQLGVSSRALGSLTRRNGVDYVNEDLHLSTAGDIVADPSAPDAWVTGIMEGAEWVKTTDGTWVPQFAENARNSINSAHKIDKKDREIQLFEEFMKKLSSNS